MEKESVIIKVETPIRELAKDLSKYASTYNDILEGHGIFLERTSTGFLAIFRDQDCFMSIFPNSESKRKGLERSKAKLWDNPKYSFLIEHIRAKRQKIYDEGVEIVIATEKPKKKTVLTKTLRNYYSNYHKDVDIEDISKKEGVRLQISSFEGLKFLLADFFEVFLD